MECKEQRRKLSEFTNRKLPIGFSTSSEGIVQYLRAFLAARYNFIKLNALYHCDQMWILKAFREQTCAKRNSRDTDNQIFVHSIWKVVE
jgi:hypothetical protein